MGGSKGYYNGRNTCAVLYYNIARTHAVRCLQGRKKTLAVNFVAQVFYVEYSLTCDEATGEPVMQNDKASGPTYV